MAIEPGTTLGQYFVIAKIGEGGMGEVYRARDTKLDRQVALKVLPQAFTEDADRLARFEREAKVLASLNHPNIAAIHGLEDSEGTKALVLELVEGPTLADRIAQGPIPVDEALPVAKQIAEALEAAHERGVIHRDLKPANVKVKDDGTVKVLDFGLAKALDPVAQGFSPADPSQSPTLTAAATQMGVVMGTAAYMSPEQARGKTVDKRGDVWAFGAVLYEMLTGKRAFIGDDVSDTLAAVLRAEVGLDDLPEDTPSKLRQVLAACLQRDPKQRVHDVADVRLAMEGAFETTVSVPLGDSSVPQRPAWRSAMPRVIGIVASSCLTGIAVWNLRSFPPPPPARFVVNPPAAEQLRVSTDSQDLAISPDGTQIVYVASLAGEDSQLYLRELDTFELRVLRGTVGASMPFFSSDGQWVGFHVPAESALQRVSLAGGQPETIANYRSILGADWGADDTVVFGTAAGLWSVPASGGTPEQLTFADPTSELGHNWPQLLPDGDALLFVVARPEGADLARLSLDEGEWEPLGPVGTGIARWAPTGHLLYAQPGGLTAVPYDPASAQTLGAPVSVIDSDTGYWCCLVRHI